MEREFRELHLRLDALSMGAGATGGEDSILPPVKVCDDAQCDSLVERLSQDDAYKRRLVSALTLNYDFFTFLVYIVISGIPAIPTFTTFSLLFGQINPTYLPTFCLKCTGMPVIYMNMYIGRVLFVFSAMLLF